MAAAGWMEAPAAVVTLGMRLLRPMAAATAMTIIVHMRMGAQEPQGKAVPLRPQATTSSRGTPGHMQAMVKRIATTATALVSIMAVAVAAAAAAAAGVCLMMIVPQVMQMRRRSCTTGPGATAVEALMLHLAARTAMAWISTCVLLGKVPVLWGRMRRWGGDEISTQRLARTPISGSSSTLCALNKERQRFQQSTPALRWS